MYKVFRTAFDAGCQEQTWEWATWLKPLRHKYSNWLKAQAQGSTESNVRALGTRSSSDCLWISHRQLERPCLNIQSCWVKKGYAHAHASVPMMLTWGTRQVAWKNNWADWPNRTKHFDRSYKLLRSQNLNMANWSKASTKRVNAHRHMLAPVLIMIVLLNTTMGYEPKMLATTTPLLCSSATHTSSGWCFSIYSESL